jgi:hypothetical protein
MHRFLAWRAFPVFRPPYYNGIRASEEPEGTVVRTAGLGRAVRSVVNTFRSTPAWRDWVARLAESERTGVPDLIDRALAQYAKKVRFPEPPPKR